MNLNDLHQCVIPYLLPMTEAILIAAISFLFLFFLRRILLGLLNKSDQKDNMKMAFARQILESAQPLLLFIFSLFLGSLWIDLGENYDLFIRKVAFISFIVLVGLWANVGVNHAIDFASIRYKHKKGASTAIFGLIRTVSKILIGATLTLFILDNLNFEVSTLLAGLGIGGIAIALAVQNILQDLFASLSIIIDKPFLIGDFIIVDDYMGTVEYVGIKTTRIRSLSGEQIIFSNTDLLKSRLRNYKRMHERRVVFSLKVAYETPFDKVKQIPEIIKKVIDNTESVRFSRCHFKDFGSYSLDFETVYFVLSSEYELYMDVQQQINQKILEAFKKEGIEFAYPTSKSIRVENSIP